MAELVATDVGGGLVNSSVLFCGERPPLTHDSGFGTGSAEPIQAVMGRFVHQHICHLPHNPNPLRATFSICIEAATALASTVL